MTPALPETPAGLKLAPPFISAGVDVGQQLDPTTLVISEARQFWTGKVRTIPERHDGLHWQEARKVPILDTKFQVRFVTRIDLGTRYAVVAQHLALYLSHPQFAGRKRIVRVDITGVGRPVYELIEDEIKHLSEAKLITCKPITFTYGDKYDKEQGRLGKAYGVSRLQALIENECIEVPGQFGSAPEQQKLHEEFLAMREEMRIYKIKVDKNGNDKYGAFEAGTHDDLATGLMLACLEDLIANQVTYGPRIR